MKPGTLRKELSRLLQELGVEERPWPGRDDGFASLLFRGTDFAHFHCDDEIDIRLGKKVIARERLTRMRDSKVHPKRAKNSPWFELRIGSKADVSEVVRLVRIAIADLIALGGA